jgi:hypothetical protein
MQALLLRAAAACQCRPADSSQQSHCQCYSSFIVMLCLRSEDVITCVANLMEVKVLYVQQDLWYEISSSWHFSV